MITPRHKELAINEVNDFVKRDGWQKAYHYYQYQLDNGDFSRNSATKRLINFKIGYLQGIATSKKQSISKVEMSYKDLKKAE